MATLDEIWSSLQQAGQGTPFMLIDCAGLEGGRDRLPDGAFSELECLFTGDLAIELADVGPWLGRLSSFAPAIRAAAGELLERHVGMLVAMAPSTDGEEPASFAHVHRHFRKFNVVYGPEGRPLFFRYYDPRVVVDVLGVMTPAQLGEFFGRAEAFVLQGPEGGILQCRRQAGRLQVTA